MCHQCGAVEKAETYLTMVNYNVQALAVALGGAK
jgi:hypothetical protein